MKKKKKNIYVGIYPAPYDKHPHNHDHNCAIITDKEIYAYDEKKLSGNKYDESASFPIRSIVAGMCELKIHPKDVDYWIFTIPKNKLSKIMLKQLFCDKLKACESKDLNNFIKNKIDFFKHHDAHASLAINVSNLHKGFFLTIDGGGDGYDSRNLLLGKFKQNKIKNIISSKSPNGGLAGFHAALTDAIGFGVNNGKTSGIASYGKIQPNLYKSLSKFFSIDDNKIPHFSLKRVPSNVNLNNFEYYNFSSHKHFNTSPSNTNIFHCIKKYKIADIAKTGEKLIKDLLVNLINHHIKLNSQDNNILVCAGGLFHNVSINQFLIDKLKFKKIFFSMSAGDGGIGLGLACKKYNEVSKKSVQISHKKYFSEDGMSPFLGPSFKSSKIISILKDIPNISYIKKKNINKDIVKLLIKGKIVGIFRGRAEYGPRSLGNRSIIADPRKINSKIKINKLIKKRDWFMPFAPAVIKDFYSEYFPKQSKSIYMQTSPNGYKNFKSIAKAGVHVDGSSRVQLVDKKINKNFWELINQFGSKTKCYCLLNTSFNRHGISTIGMPNQALEHLLSGNIEYLILEDFLITLKNNLRKNLAKKNNDDEKKLLLIHDQKFKKRIKKLKYKFL